MFSLETFTVRGTKLNLAGGALLFAASVQAQMFIRSPERFRIEVDYAIFYGNDSLNYVEFYYAIPERLLTYRQTGGKIVGAANIDMSIRRNGEVVSEKQWTAPHAVADSAQIKEGQNVVGVMSFGFPEGSYECQVVAFDFHDPAQADTIRFPIQVKTFPSDRVSLSDLELCSSIRRSDADTASVFYKNTLEVIPNVAATFGEALPVLFYYVEAYNLDRLSTDAYRTLVYMHDNGGTEVFRQGRTRKRGGTSSVEVGTVNVSKLKGGTYTMTFLLADSVTNVAISSSKKFFLYKPRSLAGERAPGTLLADVASSEFAVMQEAELDVDFAEARYIATDSDLQQYKGFAGITAEKDRTDAKRKFLFAFWKKRESSPDDYGTAFRKEYRRRVAHVNERFSGGYRRGWQTDRGRVYLKYGEPSEIDRYPNALESNPYEVWTYHHIERHGGAVFVFVDRAGYGDLVLVHSTHRNEIHDEGWQLLIRK